MYIFHSYSTIVAVFNLTTILDIFRKHLGMSLQEKEV